MKQALRKHNRDLSCTDQAKQASLSQDLEWKRSWAYGASTSRKQCVEAKLRFGHSDNISSFPYYFKTVRTC